MDTKTRTGVIGTGKMGELHLQKYLSMQNVECVGIFEPNQHRAHSLKEKYGIQTYDNLSELLFETDAVTVASTTETHFSNCKQALEAGIHVLVEKPMCDNIEQATELIRIAKDRNLTLQVGYLERFRLSKLSRLVPLQDLKLIEARWCATQMPRENGLDVIADMLVHPLDMILSLCHDEPSDIKSSGFSFASPIKDICDSRFEFPNGLIANAYVNRVAFHRERRITLISSKVSATLNFLTNHIELVRNMNGEIERTHIESNGSDSDVLKMQIESFVKCTKTNEAPLVSATDGLKVLKTLKRIREISDHSYVIQKTAIKPNETFLS